MNQFTTSSLSSAHQKATYPIRVLMLTTILNRGGLESMVMNYYRHIDRSKVQFDFVVHRKEKGAFEDEILSLGGKIYRMMPIRPLTFWKYQKQIADFFDAHPEYQIIHGHISELGYFFYKEAAKRHIPVIIGHAHMSKVPVDMKWIIRNVFKRRMRPYLTHRFTCGQAAAEWLFGKIGAQSAITQRNAIDTAGFLFHGDNRASKRGELGIEQDTFVVCHVGSFQRVKNQTFLIDVFYAIQKRMPDSILLLIGDGKLKSDMERKCQRMGLQGNVRFLGTRSDVSHLLQASDLLVFPSLFEGLPVTLIEAQCTGIPCLISDCIPQEAILTDLVTAKSLQDNADSWADMALQLKDKMIHRTKYPSVIKERGYDIQKNAEWLQKFYISSLSCRH